MTKKRPLPEIELTTQQEEALDANHGVVQGSTFVLLRHEAVLQWFGYSADELAPALEQAERGDVVAWDMQAFLKKMHAHRSP